MNESRNRTRGRLRRRRRCSAFVRPFHPQVDKRSRGSAACPAAVRRCAGGARRRRRLRVQREGERERPCCCLLLLLRAAAAVAQSSSGNGKEGRKRLAVAATAVSVVTETILHGRNSRPTLRAGKSGKSVRNPRRAAVVAGFLSVVAGIHRGLPRPVPTCPPRAPCARPS